MEQTDIIKEFYENLYSKVKDIYEIFKEFYGEDKVDLQGVLTIEEFIAKIDDITISNYINPRPISIDSEEWKSLRLLTLKDITDESLKPIIIEELSKVKSIHSIPSPFILVWWSSVKITNEFNKSVNISHLYAKVELNYDGTIHSYFTLNRAEYSYAQLISRYLHSHVSNLPNYNDTEKFQSCCTGSGPINNTIISLKVEYDKELWQLFCLELDKYVHIESIEGTPYHRLENIGKSNEFLYINSFRVISTFPKCFISDKFSLTSWEDFFYYLVESKQLKFNYKNGAFSIGMSYVDYIVTVSNLFIEWYNKEYNDKKVYHTLKNLKYSGIIIETIICGNEILTRSISDNSTDKVSLYEGKKICTFKGKDITIHITNTEIYKNENISYVLEPKLCLYFLYEILKVLNYSYGRERKADVNKLDSEIYYI